MSYFEDRLAEIAKETQDRIALGREVAEENRRLENARQAEKLAIRIFVWN